MLLLLRSGNPRVFGHLSRSDKSKVKRRKERKKKKSCNRITFGIPRATPILHESSQGRRMVTTFFLPPQTGEAFPPENCIAQGDAMSHRIRFPTFHSKFQSSLLSQYCLTHVLKFFQCRHERQNRQNFSANIFFYSFIIFF